MSITIRPIKKEDLPEISELFDSRKTVDELEWLYKNLENPSKLNAFVAVDDQNISIGIDAFILCTYSYEQDEIIGVSPITWMLKPDYKGMIGISLFKKVLNQSKTSIVIGGSKTSQDLYPLFKYQPFSNVSVYYKIIHLSAYFRSLKNEPFKKKIKMFLYLLPSRIKYASKSNLAKDVEFIRYDGTNYEDGKSFSNVFQKKLLKKHLDALLACPILSSYAYLVKHNNEAIGYCILYVQKQKGITKGRIVHVPFLGTDDKLWNSVLKNCVQILKKMNCCFISIQAQHHLFKRSSETNGFMTIKSHNTTIYARDLEGVLKEIPESSWHLQYSEGDNAYRAL